MTAATVIAHPEIIYIVEHVTNIVSIVNNIPIPNETDIQNAVQQMINMYGEDNVELKRI